MAPALTLDPGEPRAPTVELDKPSLRRRALSSVDNFPPPMEDDDMGLQSAPSLAKDSQEMEQILVDLSTGDLAQTDILQAIKTLESGTDNLSTGDADAIFPLSGFDLAEVADSEGDVVEDKIKQTQIRLERRCAFLQRRLRILQARAIGKRASEEVAQTFEKCIRGARRDGAGRPLGFKALLKKVENTAAVQASSASRSVVGPSYYHVGSSKGDVTKGNTIGIQSGTLAGLEDTAGALRSHLEVVKKELDSDATASSSGAESNDEAVPYTNTNQQPMPIEKRALWSWQRQRASISARWCWLQAQVQELEYKIRQHNDLQKTVRESKGRVEFEGEPSAYQSPLPGQQSVDDDPTLQTCARVRPLRRETFKKRKLLQMHNLHIATAKAAKPSDVKCSCLHPSESCPVCTGRAEPTQPSAPLCDLSGRQRLALADHSYHAVLSDIKDVPVATHTSTLTSSAWFRSRLGARGAGAARGGHHPSAARHAHHHIVSPPKPKRPPRDQRTPGGKRGRPPLSRKMKERERAKMAERDRDEEPVAAPTPTPTPTPTPNDRERTRSRPSTESRTSRQQSFDIDNIVIPQSVAANTRPEILTYKEIITPKWRVLDVSTTTALNNGDVDVDSSQRLSVDVDDDSDEEDVTDAAVRARHTRAEHRERGRYPRERAPTQAPPPPPPRIESEGDDELVRPYSPRRFPLPEHEYMSMLSAMPLGHARSPSPRPPGESSLSSPPSPLSPTIFDGDDPDDTEWDPSVEKSERRKSAYR